MRVRQPPREDLIARIVPGRSFLDVGCMWSVDGALCFAAEAAGASRVTGVDVMDASAAFLEERERRGSRVEFVRGDVMDEGLVEPHDVVWCSGVLYHVPDPVLALRRLRSVTRETLLLATEVVRERRFRPRTAVFAPDPGSHPAHTERFDPEAGYVGWWWGLTPSAVIAMTEAAGFEVGEVYRTRHHLTIVCRPR